MKKIIFILGLPLLFLISCNDCNNELNDNNSSNEIINESSKENIESSNINSSYEESTSNIPSEGNIGNGGGYIESSDTWIYLG